MGIERKGGAAEIVRGNTQQAWRLVETGTKERKVAVSTGTADGEGNREGNHLESKRETGSLSLLGLRHPSSDAQQEDGDAKLRLWWAARLGSQISLFISQSGFFPQKELKFNDTRL